MTKLAPSAVAALALAVPAAAARCRLLGIKGDVGRFQTLTGQDSQVRHVIVAWGQGQTWGSRFTALFQQLGGIPMIGLATRRARRRARRSRRSRSRRARATPTWSR